MRAAGTAAPVAVALDAPDLETAASWAEAEDVSATSDSEATTANEKLVAALLRITRRQCPKRTR